MKAQIAKRLYEYRKSAGLSQEQVAEKLGVSRQAVSKWECAESSPDTENLIALAMLYGVTVDELLFADPESAFEARTMSDDATVEDAAEPESVRFVEQDAANQGWERPSDPSKDYANISFKDGIHVVDSRKGEEVHIDWDGIYVDNDNEHVHLDFGALARMIREFRKDQQ